MPSPSSAHPSEADDADYITCCAMACIDLADGAGVTDFCFMGTKSGDVISYCIRDAVLQSPQRKQQRRRSSIRVVGSVALLGASMDASSPQRNGAGLSALGFCRVMVCQRAISAIAATNRWI